MDGWRNDPPLLCSPETPLDLPPAHPSTDMELVEQAQGRPQKWSKVIHGLCCGGKLPWGTCQLHSLLCCNHFSSC